MAAADSSFWRILDAGYLVEARRKIRMLLTQLTHWHTLRIRAAAAACAAANAAAARFNGELAQDNRGVVTRSECRNGLQHFAVRPIALILAEFAARLTRSFVVRFGRRRAHSRRTAARARRRLSFSSHVCSFASSLARSHASLRTSQQRASESESRRKQFRFRPATNWRLAACASVCVCAIESWSESFASLSLRPPLGARLRSVYIPNAGWGKAQAAKSPALYPACAIEAAL